MIMQWYQMMFISMALKVMALLILNRANMKEKKGGKRLFSLIPLVWVSSTCQLWGFYERWRQGWIHNSRGKEE